MATTTSGQRSHMGNIPTHVIKVGGENASDPRTTEWLARFHREGNQIAVALSALRTNSGLNTTTELMESMNMLFGTKGRCTSDAYVKLRKLKDAHLNTLRSAGMLDSILEQKLQSLYQEYFPSQLSYPTDLVKGDISTLQEQRFIGYGEVMSAHVLSHMLSTRYGVQNIIIDDMLESERRNLNNTLRDELGKRVRDILTDGSIAIVPGYQRVHNMRIVPTYGRGYTDKVAERIAVGLADQGMNPILHIQKQVPLLSSDPRKNPNTRTIENLSYHTAAEITGARGANAQVLNPHTITPELVESGIPVWVYNPFKQDAPKSIISKNGESESKILFVDSRNHVSTITVSGFAMSGPGLLARLTDIFGKMNISIDSISSSETEVTFTTYGKMSGDQKSELEKTLQGTLGKEYTVDVRNNLGLIYCIGDNLAGHPGLLEKISGILARENIDIECISQSRGQRAVTIGVHSDNLGKGTESLHRALIEK